MTIKVFYLNEYEYWAGRDLEEVIAAAMEATGLSREEVAEDPHELDDGDMDTLLVMYDEEKPEATRTFRQQLDVEMEFRRACAASISDDPEKPFIFAGND